MAYSNPKEAFENIVEGARSGLMSAFPIKGRAHSLHLEDVAVEAKDTKDPMDIASQYKARMAGESWFTPLYGKLVIRDNATNAVVQSKKMRLMDLPTMTSRLSYIHKGQEYQVADQWQLKPGVYARRRQNGELEARFNVTGRSAFDMTFDPESQKFQIEYKKANLPAYPILKAMGVSDEALAHAWGHDILKANQELKRNATTLVQFHRTSTNGQTPATDQEAIDNLKKVMEASKLRPEVTAMTLGKPFEHVTGDAMLLAGKKLLQVQQGHPEDDRDAIIFKTLRATGELLHDQVKNSAKVLTHKIQRQINKGENPKLSKVFSTGMFTAATSALFQSSLANPAKQINPLDMHSSALQTTIMGPGGIKSEMQVTDEAKMINASQFGFIDPLATPEGSSTGVSLRLPLGVKKIGEQPHIPLYNLKTKKTDWVDPVTAFNHKVVLADQVDYKDGVPHALHKDVRMMGVGNKLEVGKLHDADYVMKHPSQIFNLTSAMVPFVGNDSGNRVSMAVRHMEQAISLQGREAPLVQSLSPSGSSFEKVFGHQIAHLSPVEGNVTKVTPKGITVQAADGKDHFVHLYDNYPLNDTKSVLHSEAKVRVGDKVGSGQLIADSNYTRDGHLALGKNLKVAYMSYHGKNFEDSFVVTESAAKKLSSIHLHKHELPIREDTVVGLKKFQIHNPGLFTQDQVKHIQEDGVIKVGAKVRPGDPLVLALQPFNIKDRVGLGALRKSLTNQHSDKSIRWDGSQEGEVVAVHRGPEGIQVHVHTVEPLQVADKLCFDEKTEVLTRTGWKPVAEVGLHDEVCTLVDGVSCFQQPEAVYAYAVGGRMVRASSTHVDLLTTAAHRAYVERDGLRSLVPVEELIGVAGVTYLEEHEGAARPLPGEVLHTDVGFSEQPVYCVTVPGHVLYVRRNGKPCWSGNSNRHGGKGVVGYIIPDNEAPHGKDGKPVDILFQPAGVGGRMNVGQILETMAGKVAQKTGSTYFVKNFDGHSKDRVDEMKKELKAHGLSDTEELTDPKTGLSYGQVLTGPQHFIKLVHQVDKKESVRSGMGLPKLPSNERYDSLTFQPASGDGTGGQSFGQLGLYALLAHGATNILRSAMTYKAQGEDPETNEAKRWKSDHALAWLAMQKGQPLPPPKPTFAYHRFTEMLKGAGINMEKKGSSLVISPLTDKHILEMSKGEIATPSAAVHAKIDPAINHYRPIKGGLFDEKITGGHGGTAWSHVRLAEPLPNPVFEEPIKKVLGITGPRFESILQGTARVDPKTGKDSASGITGGAALKAMLEHIQVDADLKKTKEELKNATPSAADALYKKARYLQALQKLGMKPSEAYILHNVPILPPKLRPLSIMEDGKLRYEDVNGLYMQMGQMNEELVKPEMKLLPDSAKAALRQNLYDSIKNIYGTGSLPEGSKQKGLLQTIHGTSPKLGLVQKGLLSPRQDMSMRSVIIPGPDLHLDQVGLPKDNALTLFRPFVIHQLVKQGTARNENHAQDLLSEVHRGKNDPMVWKALEQVVAERPVLLKRDPALHKYSLQSFYATLVGGSSIKLHPLVTGGFNADHDGDSCEGPVLLSTPEGLTKVELSDFPRIEESKRAAGPNTDAYSVPQDLFVFGMQDSTMKLYRVTEYSVHKNLHVWEVVLSSGEKIRCSSDHSLACLDMHTLKAAKFIPNESVGHAVPTLGLLEGHHFDEFKLDDAHVRSATPELGEEIGKFLAYQAEKPETAVVFEQLGLSLSHPEGVKASSPEGEAWTKLLSEDFLRKAVLYPLAFRQALLTRYLQQRLHQDDSTAKCPDQEGLFLLSRSVGLSCIKRGATLVVYEASSLIQAAWFKPQGWRKKARLRGGYFSQVPFPAWVQDECPVKYRKDSPQGWLRRETLQVLLKELEEKGLEPSGYFASWKRMVTAPHLFWERVESASPTGERRDLYDITVESAQNFLLSTGTLVWDTMSVYVPSTHEEIHDALKMLPSRNIFSDTTGAPAFTPSMEAQLGLHRLSKVGDKTAHTFKTHEEVADALARQKIKVNDQVSLAGKMTTPGRVLLASAAPAAFKEKMLHDLSFELNGKGTKGLFHDVGKHSPSLFPTFADEMKQLGYDAATGMIRTPLTKHKVIPIGAHSYSLEDFSTDKVTRDKHMGVAEQEIANLPKNLPVAEHERQVVDAYLAAIQKMTKEHNEVAKDPATRKNNLQAMTAAGIKPSAGQYQQMRLLPGIMSDSKGNLIPTPIATSYGEGLDLGAYWIGSYGARSGTVKKVQEVQEPGYMTKLLQNTSMGTLVDQHDCGTRKGILMPVTHSDIADRHLAQDLKMGHLHLHAGALLDKRTLDAVRTADPQAQLLVRSPLECASEKGVCQKCFGLNANGHHHAMGTNIGVLSAHALGERAVQLTLKEFHSGGAVTGRGGGNLGAFQRLEQLTYLPDKTPNSAVLAKVSGKITAVEPTNTGVQVHIDGVPHFVGKDPTGLDLHTELMGTHRDPKYQAWKPPVVGATVVAGQHLSDPNRTLVNPHRLYEATKDISKVKEFLANEMHRLYEAEGVRKRAVEVVVRSMGNITKIEDAKDHPDLLRGQFYPRSAVLKINEDRKKAGQPLIEHRPTLMGVNLLPLAATEDWLAVLNHQKLRSTLMQNAALGAKSDLHGHHPIPGLIYGAEFGKPKGGTSPY